MRDTVNSYPAKSPTPRTRQCCILCTRRKEVEGPIFRSQGPGRATPRRGCPEEVHPPRTMETGAGVRSITCKSSLMAHSMLWLLMKRLKSSAPAEKAVITVATAWKPLV